MTPGEQTFSDDKAGVPCREPTKASENVAEAKEEEAGEEKAREERAKEEEAGEERIRGEKPR